MAVVQRFLAIVAGAYKEVVAATAGGAGSAGQLAALDPTTGLLALTMMPSGIGPDVQTAVASEAISAGAFINFWNNAGVASVRNADGSTTGKQADGFVLSAVAASGTATVYLGGINTSVSGQTAGIVYLSDTAVGMSAAAGATTAGHTFQQIGVAVSATAIQFDPQQPIVRA